MECRQDVEYAKQVLELYYQATFSVFIPGFNLLPRYYCWGPRVSASSPCLKTITIIRLYTQETSQAYTCVHLRGKLDSLLFYSSSACLA